MIVIVEIPCIRAACIGNLLCVINVGIYVSGHDDRQSGYDDHKVGRQVSRGGISKRTDRSRGSRHMDTSRMRRIIEQDEEMGAGGSAQPEGHQR